MHEQVSLALQRLGAEIRRTDIVIQHTGGVTVDAFSRKLERNLRLLNLEDADRPNDPLTLFNIATAHYGLGQPAAALPIFLRCLEHSAKGFPCMASCSRRSCDATAI